MHDVFALLICGRDNALEAEDEEPAAAGKLPVQSQTPFGAYCAPSGRDFGYSTPSSRDFGYSTLSWPISILKAADLSTVSYTLGGTALTWAGGLCGLCRCPGKRARPESVSVWVDGAISGTTESV
jgi:hypothetical protein